MPTRPPTRAGAPCGTCRFPRRRTGSGPGLPTERPGPTVEPPSGEEFVASHIALVAHDNKKLDLLRWAEYNRGTLRRHHLYATGTTGTLLEFELGLPVTRFLSGPVGGDQQIGAKIAEGVIDMLFFFWDPLEAQPHDPDVRALLRLAVVWNIPMACNVASADLIISSPLVAGRYRRVVPSYAARVPNEVVEPRDEDQSRPPAASPADGDVHRRGA